MFSVNNENEKVLRQKTKYSNIVQIGNGTFLRTQFSGSDPETTWRKKKILEMNEKFSMHANLPQVFSFTSNKKTGDFSILSQYVDCSDLKYYLNAIKQKNEKINASLEKAKKEKNTNSLKEILNDRKNSRLHQIQFAKSVARQLIDLTLYLDAGLNYPHKNYNPDTILFHSSGILKALTPNFLDEIYGAENPLHFFCFNAYAAPEISPAGIYNQQNYKNSLTFLKDLKYLDKIKLMNRRIKNATTSSDLWSIGVIIFSILTGINYMPNLEYNEPVYIKIGVDVPEKRIIQITEKILNVAEEQITKFHEFKKFITSASEDDWDNISGNDPMLKYILKRCLVIEKENRATVSEIAAAIYLLGGFVETGNEIETKISDLVLLKRVQNNLKFLENWQEIHDPFSTHLEVFTCILGVEKEKRMEKLLTDIDIDTELNDLFEEKKSIEKYDYGIQYLKYIKNFNNLRTSFLYKRYFSNEIISDSLLAIQEFFPPDDYLTYFFSDNGKIFWHVDGLKISNHPLSLLINDEIDNLRCRRINERQTSEKIYRKIILRRQKFCAIAVQRALVFFTNGFEK